MQFVWILVTSGKLQQSPVTFSEVQWALFLLTPAVRAFVLVNTSTIIQTRTSDVFVSFETGRRHLFLEEQSLNIMTFTTLLFWGGRWHPFPIEYFANAWQRHIRRHTESIATFANPYIPWDVVWNWQISILWNSSLWEGGPSTSLHSFPLALPFFLLDPLQTAVGLAIPNM